jgi:hypothetical protein
MHLPLARNHPIGEDIWDICAFGRRLHSDGASIGVDGTDLRGADEEVADEGKAARWVDDGRLVPHGVEQAVRPSALLPHDARELARVVEP